MIGTSVAAWVFIRLSILTFEAIPVLSWAALLLKALSRLQLWPTESWLGHLPLWLYLYFTAECIFSLWFYFVRRPAILAHNAPHPIIDAALRKKIWEQTKKCSIPISEHLSGWFYGTPLEDIGRENIKEWLLWSMYNTSRGAVNNLPPAERQPLIDDLDRFINDLEAHLKVSFPDGYTDGLRMMRLNQDEVVAQHKPLIYYLIVMLMDSHVHLHLRWLGGTHYAPSERSYQLSDEPNHVLPFVFVHGIGTGLHIYLPLLHALAKQHPDVPIFCIEMMHVSMRVVDDVPSGKEVAEDLVHLLHHHGYKEAVFVGHSLGTVTLRHILDHPPAKKMAASLVFLDPITFLLLLPDIAYNFVYRMPRRANEWLMYWFVSTEGGISWSLGRHFWWFQNVLWRDDLVDFVHSGKNKQIMVLVSGADVITPGKLIFDYLADDATRAKAQHSDDAMLSQSPTKETPWHLLYYQHLDHAQCLVLPSARQEIVTTCAAFCHPPRC